jgi:PilZ domain-containing protein
MVMRTRRPHNQAMDNRRAELRDLVREDAFVWELCHMKAGYQAAIIVDVSSNGMRLELGRRLMQGSQVAIDFRDMVICGTVRYCRQIENRFAMGIRIKDVLDPLREEPAGCSANEQVCVQAVVALA